MNKNFVNIIDNQKGQVALLITLTTMFLLMFIGLFLTDVLSKQIKTTLNKIHSSQAYYLADTGAEHMSYKLIRGGLDISSYDNNDPLTDNIFGGSYRVILLNTVPTISLNSIGDYRQTNRNVRLQW